MQFKDELVYNTESLKQALMKVQSAVDKHCETQLSLLNLKKSLIIINEEINLLQTAFGIKITNKA